MKEHIFHEGRRLFYFYYATMYMDGIKEQDRFNYPLKGLIISKNNITEVCHVDTGQTHKKTLRKYLKEKQLIDELIDFINKRDNDFLTKLKKFGNPKNKSNEELLSIYRDYYEFTKNNFRIVNSIIRTLDRTGTALLRKKLEEKGYEDVDNAITILCSTEKRSYIAQEEMKVLKMILELLKKYDKQTLIKNLVDIKEFKANVDEILRNYSWVSKGFFDEKERNIDYYRNEVISILKDGIDIMEKLESLKDLSNRILKQRDEMLNKADFEEEELLLLKILRECAFLKDYTRGSHQKASSLFKSIFSEIGKRLGLDEKEVRTITIQEMEDGLLKDRKINKDIIKKRFEFYVLKVDNISQEFQILYDEEAKKIEESYIKSILTETKELKGRIASRGIGKGSVKIINSINDFSKFEKGDILVTNNTTPDFVPIMKMANAIVTEEGGITTHAAIISRELKVPCIVGIENITKILKDNDKVVVDAYKGIVTKK